MTGMTTLTREFPTVMMRVFGLGLFCWIVFSQLCGLAAVLWIASRLVGAVK